MLEKMHLKINTLRQELCLAAAGRHRLELPAHQKSLQRGAGLFCFSTPFLLSWRMALRFPGHVGRVGAQGFCVCAAGHAAQILLPHVICSAQLMAE